MTRSKHVKLCDHWAACQKQGCKCRLYYRHRDAWKNQLGPWLWHVCNTDGEFTCWCLLCKRKLPCYFASLKRHSESAGHLLTLSVLTKTIVPFRLVPVASFVQLLQQFQTGAALWTRRGLQVPEGIIGPRKGNDMLSCLSEAVSISAFRSI